MILKIKVLKKTNKNTWGGSRSVINPLNPSLAYSFEVNFRGEVDGQNLCGCQSPRISPIYGGDGLVQDGLPTTPKPNEEFFTIDLWQSINQILGSFGHKPNANPREGFDVFACICCLCWLMENSFIGMEQETRR